RGAAADYGARNSRRHQSARRPREAVQSKKGLSGSFAWQGLLWSAGANLESRPERFLTARRFLLQPAVRKRTPRRKDGAFGTLCCNPWKEFAANQANSKRSKRI